jgi:CDP-paratose 2-epimerase
LSGAPSLVFTSTNKVYGSLDVELEAERTRYVPRDARVRERGIDEARALDFHSPYGCSKGAADQYVLDYARSFGLRTVVLRMSCIYGPHQNGNEDQGWVAHFVRHALTDRAVTIYGNGKQVRDVLFIDDLLNALDAARRHITKLSGRAFNIGGGPDNTLSLLELVAKLEAAMDERLEIAFADWRVGDQRYYVSDTARFSGETGWRAAIAPDEGLALLRDWLETANAHSAAPVRSSAAVAEARP